MAAPTMDASSSSNNTNQNGAADSIILNQHLDLAQVENEEGRGLVKAGQFPNSNSLKNNYKTGQLIYSIDENLVPGNPYQMFEHEDDTIFRNDDDTLRRDSVLFFYERNEKVYMVKKSDYRQDVLNTWSLLNHPNIVPLLGVVIGDPSMVPCSCYRFMPCMTGDLYHAVIPIDDIYTWLQHNIIYVRLVMRNIRYIIKEVLKGLVKMDELHIQHGDIKADNIFVDQRCSCNNILLCTCYNKYSVFIGDLDSSNRLFKEHAIPLKIKLYDGRPHYNLVGPWSDIWDLGVMLVELIFGSASLKDLTNWVALLRGQMHMALLTKIVATKRLLDELSKVKHPAIKPLLGVIRCCLEVDAAQRRTANELQLILT